MNAKKYLEYQSDNACPWCGLRLCMFNDSSNLLVVENWRSVCLFRESWDRNMGFTRYMERMRSESV